MRLLQGFSNNLIIEMMHRDEEKYFHFFRMHLQSSNELFTLIALHITKQIVVRTPILARMRFDICIRYLAASDSFQSLSYAFRVAPNTISKIISETCQYIWDVLAEIVFPEPTEQLWYQKACDYEDLWNFPNCIGSINGKHIVLQVFMNLLKIIYCTTIYCTTNYKKINKNFICRHHIRVVLLIIIIKVNTVLCCLP